MEVVGAARQRLPQARGARAVLLLIYFCTTSSPGSMLKPIVAWRTKSSSSLAHRVVDKTRTPRAKYLFRHRWVLL